MSRNRPKHSLSGKAARERTVPFEMDSGEVAIALLLAKLHDWLDQQPEWEVLLRSDRTTRRLFGRKLADAITTYPERQQGIEQARLEQAARKIAEESKQRLTVS